MKNNILKKPIILGVALIVASLSLTACGQTSSISLEDYEELRDELKELEKENEELRKELKEYKGEKGGISLQKDKEESDFKDDSDDSFVVETSGVCGNNLTWEYGNGILKIKGDGDMTDYIWNSSGSGKAMPNYPWGDISEKIGHVKISKGVTSIGSYAFADLYNLSNVDIPDSVTVIGESAFWRTNNLKEIKLPDKVSAIGKEALLCGVTEEAAAEAAEAYAMEEGELMYRVVYRWWRSLMSPGMTVFYKGTAYQDNDSLCNALWDAGVAIEPMQENEFDMPAAYYTPNDGEIVEEFYWQ